MNDIAKIWDEIEQSAEKGLLKRLYNVVSGVQFYVIFQNPEKYFGIALSIDKRIEVNVSSFADLRDIRVSLKPDNSFAGKNLLLIRLLQPDSRDIFSIICENILQAVSCLQTEKQMVHTLLNQLKKWEVLFERLRGSGLSFCEQQGLFGELHFLQKQLQKHEFVPVVISWVGADKNVRDFQYANWALEVKTSSGSNHQKITINSERQLDESLLSDLFLFHLSVEVSKGNGETLNDKVEQIRQQLKENIMASGIFNEKLYEAGYFDRHRKIYAERCYKIRDENFYKVEGEFPRIREGEVRSGVGDVEYSVILSLCQEYLVSEETVHKVLNDSWKK